MNTHERRVLLQIEGLKTHFFIGEGVVRAVDDVSLTLHEGSTLGIVGESGCGKSMTALSVMRLIPKPGKIMAGEILFRNWGNLLDLTGPDMRKIRGNKISMIFQEPMTSLNPVMRIGNQMVEAIKFHQKVPKREALNRSVELLKLVGISSPEKIIKDYPHQLSGGMRQRVMIGMALSCNPELMLADEPTTALDVTIQAQILNLMNKLKEKVGTSIILITHDLGVIAEMAEYVCVMYAGMVVETADVRTLFTQPVHPYTVGLLESIPRIDTDTEGKVPLNTIEGVVPDLLDLPPGCSFSTRCSHVHDLCNESKPPLEMIEEDHFVRCWFYKNGR
jgi:oligopeptide/dipeptide ABC transporter ATP-binding protein